ncbi:MAG: GNAT family N-acetyltransferase [candidate division WOR-3 bacterium]
MTDNTFVLLQSVDSGLAQTTSVRQLNRLLADYPYYPYYWFGSLAPNLKPNLEVLADYLKSQIQNYMKNNAVVINHRLGLAVAVKDEWDSQHFNCLVFKIPYLIAAFNQPQNVQETIKASLIEKILKALIAQSPVYVFTRLPDADVTSIRSLQRLGFTMIDSLITFAQILPNSFGSADSFDTVSLIETIESNLELPPELLVIARDAFRYDRFHTDPIIAELVGSGLNNLYADWIVNGWRENRILLALGPNRTITGFLIYRIETISYFAQKIATIELIATHPDYRNRGIGKRLVTKALDLFVAKGARIASVGTQAQNFPAIRLYQSCGFKIITSFVSFRKWLIS